MATREQIVKKAQSWVGLKEKDGSFKVIIDTYNVKPLPRGYKVKYTDEWCATFVSAVAVACGATDIIPKECGCGKMRDLFIKLGSWQERDDYVPYPGDVIFYDWKDKKNYAEYDNKGSCAHVGIVEKVEGKKITVIEGNKSKSVSRRTLNVNGRYIRGYGCPKYEELISEKPIEIQQYPTVSFAIGDRVKLTKDATVYGSKKKFSSWVYLTKLYVRQVSKDRVVVSTKKSGAITGAVDKKHLKKV
jgi:hypothetical protein